MQTVPRKVREFKRREQEILDTALSLFLAHGEDSVTVELIADTVGIGKGTIYKHFKSKAEIYLRLMLDYIQNCWIFFINSSRKNSLRFVKHNINILQIIQLATFVINNILNFIYRIIVMQIVFKLN